MLYVVVFMCFCTTLAANTADISAKLGELRDALGNTTSGLIQTLNNTQTQLSELAKAVAQVGAVQAVPASTQQTIADEPVIDTEYKDKSFGDFLLMLKNDHRIAEQSSFFVTWGRPEILKLFYAINAQNNYGLKIPGPETKTYLDELCDPNNNTFPTARNGIEKILATKLDTTIKVKETNKALNQLNITDMLHNLPDPRNHNLPDPRNNNKTNSRR